MPEKRNASEVEFELLLADSIVASMSIKVVRQLAFETETEIAKLSPDDDMKN
jgi:hypothetical protein